MAWRTGIYGTLVTAGYQRAGQMKQGVGDRYPRQRGSWQQLSCETVYENPWISVSHEQVVTPAGTEFTALCILKAVQ
jgi:hypothetical protein